MCKINSFYKVFFSSLAGYCGVHPLPLVLRLHDPDGAVVLAANRHNWLLCSLYVHQENLCCGEDWLSGPSAPVQTFLVTFLLFCFLIQSFLFVMSNKHWFVRQRKRRVFTVQQPHPLAQWGATGVTELNQLFLFSLPPSLPLPTPLFRT